MSRLVGFIVACVAFVLLMWTVSYSLDRSAKIECIDWNEEATHMLGYYVTSNQVAQCEYVGYPLNADIEVK
jgi:hypothetical protein